MKYPALHKAKREAKDKINFWQQVLDELEEVENFMKKYDCQLQRKKIAKILDCTPQHVSRLKKQGKLESYRITDVINYIKTHR